MVFDKRPGPMERENMHTFSFGAEEVEHLLAGTVPDPTPSYWEYRRGNVVEKVVDRARYGGEGIIVEFRAEDLEVPGFSYVYSDASPLMFGFTPGVAVVSGLYRMTHEDPLTIAPVGVEDLIP